MKYIDMDQALVEECLHKDINIDKLAKGWGISHADALVKASQVRKDFFDVMVLMCRMKTQGKASLKHVSRLSPIFERMGIEADAAAWFIKEFSEPLE